MTREEAYNALIWMDEFVNWMKICQESDCECNIRSIDDRVFDQYSLDMLLYVKLTEDEKFALECCRIDRGVMTRCEVSFRRRLPGVCMAGKRLYEIQNFALSKFWGISYTDIERDAYYINRDGICKNSSTQEVLPRLADRGKEPQHFNNPTDNPEPLRLPDELNTDNGRKYIDMAINLGFIQTENNSYVWKGTKKELALFAVLIGEKLQIRGYFKLMELLFNVKYLAQYRYTAIEVNGVFGKNEKMIKEIFNN